MGSDEARVGCVRRRKNGVPSPVRFLTATGLLVVLAACEKALPPEYEFLRQSSYAHGDEEIRIREGLPYERVELEFFSPWMWGGDQIMLAADGSAEMLDSEGRRTARVSLFDFGHVCYVLETNEFESMEPRYSSEVFDAGTVTVRVWPKGASEPISVESYASAAPIEFTTIVACIEGAARGLWWKPLDEQFAHPESEER